MNGIIIKIASFVLFVLTILFVYQLIEICNEIVVGTNSNSNDDFLSSHQHHDHDDDTRVFHVSDLNQITSIEKQKKCQTKFLDMPITKQQQQLNNENENECRDLLSDEIKIAFQKDGVVAIRGLLSSSLLSQLQTAGTYLTKDTTRKKKNKYTQQRRNGSGRQFHTTKMGAIFLNNNDNDDDDLSIFRTVAIHSILPQISSELMGMYPSTKHSSFLNHKITDTQHDTNETLRVLR